MRKVRRDIHWDVGAWQSFLAWQTADPAIFAKIITLLNECLGDNPFKGTGQPEPLKHELQGYWSRRLNREHRLVYEVSDECIYVLQCGTHYQKK